MKKKFFLLIVTGFFLLGAIGGCSTPNFSGDWSGTLTSSLKSDVSGTVTITNLTQDVANNFVGGVVVINYIFVSYPANPLPADIIGGSTGPFEAKMIAEGTVADTNVANALNAIALATSGIYLNAYTGEKYQFLMNFSHGYGCTGDGDTLIGEYELIHYKQGTWIKIDKGAVSLYRD